MVDPFVVPVHPDATIDAEEPSLAASSHSSDSVSTREPSSVPTLTAEERRRLTHQRYNARRYAARSLTRAEKRAEEEAAKQAKVEADKAEEARLEKEIEAMEISVAEARAQLKRLNKDIDREVDVARHFIEKANHAQRLDDKYCTRMDCHWRDECAPGLRKEVDKLSGWEFVKRFKARYNCPFRKWDEDHYPNAIDEQKETPDPVTGECWRKLFGDEVTRLEGIMAWGYEHGEGALKKEQAHWLDQIKEGECKRKAKARTKTEVQR